MEWVASTLHTASEHGVYSITARSEPGGTWLTHGRGSEGEIGEWSG